MSEHFIPSEYGYGDDLEEGEYYSSREERKEAWFKAAENYFDTVFRSGREVRSFLRKRGSEDWIKSATHSKHTSGWFYSVNIDRSEIDFKEYRRRYEVLEDFLEDTNASPH